MSSLQDQLQFIIEGGAVERFHTRTGIKPDTDAQHSHGVAMLCHLLSTLPGEPGTGASANLLMAALSHDLAEQVASDISAPTKWKLNIGAVLEALEQEQLDLYDLNFLRMLTEDERRMLKLADTLDGLLYCCREAALGNRRIGVIWRRWNAYIHLQNMPERAMQIYEAITAIYMEITNGQGPSFDCFR